MRLEEFAQNILYATTLEDKLALVELEAPRPDSPLSAALTEAPSFPGRPATLARPGKAEFPSLQRLIDPVARGEVLHFFANHELLAMELMALVLLRFPEAPVEFRMGVARTIQEEQSHLRLYLQRMRELGVDFGDLPVSDYFWNALSGMRSPLDFVVQMSLTFEQANLDYSHFYMEAVRQVGDEATGAILERVFREEIGHVKHGVTWFNRWRESPTQGIEGETDWQAYQRLLPSPMTPRRAKGLGFCAEARREAGLSETFIRELRLHSGSRGRPPTVWLYNPHCDSEIARGRPGFTANAGARGLSRDLSAIPLFLAREADLVLVERRPRTEWLESLARAGFEIPELVPLDGSEIARAVTARAPKLGGIEPWGWSPDMLAEFRPLRSRLVSVAGGNAQWCEGVLARERFEETGFAPLFSKAWSARFLKSWLEAHPQAQTFFGESGLVGTPLENWTSCVERVREILDEGSVTLAKAPYGTSGMQVREIRSLSELEGPLGGWIRRTLARQGEIVIEHRLDKILDLSIQLEVPRKRLEIRRFIIDGRHAYKGTMLGTRRPGFSAESARFLHEVTPAWESLLKDLATRLNDEGYQGPAGVDALLWRSQTGGLRMKPLVELNPRWTMGRVALELEKRLAPGVNALWLFLPVRELKARGFENANAFAEWLAQRHPTILTPPGSGRQARLESGLVFTNDPMDCHAILTVFATLPNPDLEAFIIESV
jgi:uncharacterized ferritin-like protein (DUF455 family)